LKPAALPSDSQSCPRSLLSSSDVVYVIKENRTYHRFFGTLPGTGSEALPLRQKGHAEPPRAGLPVCPGSTTFYCNCVPSPPTATNGTMEADVPHGQSSKVSAAGPAVIPDSRR